MAIDWSAASTAAATDTEGQAAAERLLRAAHDLDALTNASRAAKAALLAQAAELLEGAVAAAPSITSPGGGGLLALASGTTASAPAATPVAVVDPKLEAIASSLGLTADNALNMLEQMAQAIGLPVTGAAPAAARGIAAEGAFRGRVTVREDSSPPGMVLSDGAVSTGPAPAPLPGPSGVPQVEHDAVVAARDAALSNLTAVTAERDAAVTACNTAVTERDSFAAARTALVAALAMPSDRRNKADRDAAIQAALGQLKAV